MSRLDETYFRATALLTWLCMAMAQGSPSWPPAEEVCSLADTLDGELLLPGNPRYDELRELKNTYYTNTPGMIILAKSEGDVMQGLSLARAYNLQPTVSSSGHDYVGRSTANNSIHIDMSAMTGIIVNPDDPDSDTGASAVIESGNNWAMVYKEVDQYGLLAIGGSAPTVSAGGYIQGGGHSPMTRSLGLGVDSVLGITLVTANGSLVYVDEEGIHSLDPSSEKVDPDTDLFWALLGGGGGTYGIVTSFKVRLYEPPTSFFHFSKGFAMQSGPCGDFGAEIMRAFLSWYKDNLDDNRIGGYIMSSNERINIPIIGFNGSITFASLFFGPWEEAYPIYEPLINLRPECLPVLSMTNYSTFWEYQENINDATGYPAYIINRFIQEDDLDDEGFISTMTSNVFDHDIILGCTATLIGGQARSAPEGRTAVSPNFRFGTQSTSCGTGWANEAGQEVADHHIAELGEWGEKFYQHGQGVYFNEPDYFLEDWKTEYWGSMETYDRLLAVKQRWDPDHIFWCHKCVGSDLRDPPSDTEPTGDRVTDDMCSQN